MLSICSSSENLLPFSPLLPQVPTREVSASLDEPPVEGKKGAGRKRKQDDENRVEEEKEGKVARKALGSLTCFQVIAEPVNRFSRVPLDVIHLIASMWLNWKDAMALFRAYPPLTRERQHKPKYALLPKFSNLEYLRLFFESRSVCEESKGRVDLIPFKKMTVNTFPQIAAWRPSLGEIRYGSIDEGQFQTMTQLFPLLRSLTAHFTKNEVLRNITNCRNLRELKLIGKGLTIELLIEISEQCPVEMLIIYDAKVEALAAIPFFRRLTSLELNGAIGPLDSVLNEIAAGCTQLRKVKIYGLTELTSLHFLTCGRLYERITDLHINSFLVANPEQVISLCSELEHLTLRTGKNENTKEVILQKCLKLKSMSV
jgi:hypothetical protein